LVELFMALYGSARPPYEERMDDLVIATTPVRATEETFTLEVHPGWQQGRGAFGGLVLGALARAMIACEEDADRALRSLAGELAGPVLVGAASIEVRALRRGNAVSTWSALLRQNGEVLARASAVLGRTRPNAHAWSPPPPKMRPWREVEAAPARVLGPDFAQFFEYRPTGPLPFSGGSDPLAEGWVRPVKAPQAIGPAEIIATIDAYWPAAFAIEKDRRPVGTIAFTMQYFPPPAPPDPAAPLYYRARAVAAQDGYLVEHRELWTPEGQLLALNPQTFVWIK
jgi:acyl-CoA thioesterase